MANKLKRLLVLALLGLTGCSGLMQDISRRFAESDIRTKVLFLAHLDISWPPSAANFAKALAFARAEEVDAVVVIGDPTHKQRAGQYAVFRETFSKAFPKASAPKLLVVTNDLVLAVGDFRFAVVASRPMMPCKLPTFYADGRLPLTDGLCVMPLGWNAVHVGSMHGIDVPESYDVVASPLAAGMKSSAQGVLALDCGPRTILRRLDFIRSEDVAAPWTLPMDEQDPAAKAVPAFWPDTRLSVTRGYGSKGETLYTARWPNLLAQYAGVRAYSYEVTVRAGGRIAFTRNVLPPGFYLSEGRDAPSVNVSFPQKALGAEGPVEISIVPITSFGVRGKELKGR